MPEPTTVNLHHKAEADAVRELAYRAASPKEVGELHRVIVVPDDHTLEEIDTEWLQGQPTRKRGTVVLRDAFNDERVKIETTTGVPTFAGVPPEGVGR